MPFGPWVPDHQIGPAMCPSYHEHAETVMIKQMHSVVFNTGRYAFAGGAPACEQISSIWITQDHCEQRFTTTVTGYGHLM